MKNGRMLKSISEKYNLQMTLSKQWITTTVVSLFPPLGYPMSATVFLLAAGFGTRLRPTNHRPKPLLPLLGRPMVDFAVIYNHGHREFVVNAHHVWEKVQNGRILPL